MRRSERSRDRGASLVEFALVIPLLTLFLFGIVQFGIAYDKQQSINSGAREGARLAALKSSTLDEIATRAVESADVSAVGNDPEVRVYDDLDNLHGVRCAGGAYRAAADCPAASDSHPDELDAEEMPCGEDPLNTDDDDDTPSEFVRVVVSTPYDITIPFFGVQTVDIDSEAEFRCERQGN